MLKYFATILLLTLIGGCSAPQEEAYTGSPAINVNFKGLSSNRIVIEVKSVNTEAVSALALLDSEPVPAPETIVKEGVRADKGKIVIGDLEEGGKYNVYVVGFKDSKYSEVYDFFVEIPTIYPWEMERTEIPTFADLDLIPGGVTTKKPNTWDAKRMAPHVTFTDENGQEHWLHEAFLFIGNEDATRKTVMSIPETEARSAGKDSWVDFASYWLSDGGVVDVVDHVIAEAIARIGRPSFKHSVVITLPDPIMLEYFSDKNSSTTYWGEIGGRKLDFANVSDQILAYKWFIDHLRKAWKKAAPEHLELAGFYILSENLVAKPSGWNYKYKRWDKILPAVADYLHELKYGLYWIPYYQADGYDMTAKLGIDYTFLQPNKYWDYPGCAKHKSWDWVFNTMTKFCHGMEIEFEGTHGEAGWSQAEPGLQRTSSSILEMLYTDTDLGKAGEKNPYADRNKALLREYMTKFKEAGFYGKARIATYSGTDAMYELASSPYPKDREMYLDYCKFITGSPLRK